MPPRPPSLLTSPLLRRLLLRPFTSTPASSEHHRLLLPTQPQRRPQSPFNPYFIFSKHFSSQTLASDDLSEISESLSLEILKSDSDLLPLPQRLDSSFPHVSVSPPLILQTLESSKDASRVVLEFLSWIAFKLPLSDEVCSYFIRFFGGNRDFRSMEEVLVRGKGVLGPLSFDAYIDKCTRLGSPSKAVVAFDRMELDLGLPRNRDALNVVVARLCERGYGNHAENLVNSLAHEFFPNQYICDLLITGWCNADKLDEARRLAREMYRGGFELGVTAFNAILDCVCRLARKKDPFRLVDEANLVLADMKTTGVARNVETFNVWIDNLCKIRKTEEAMQAFSSMGEWEVSPDQTTFLLLIRSLYRAGRLGEGDEMLDKMKSAGFGGFLDEKAYYDLLRRLCGVQRIDHALSLFARMKESGIQPLARTYALLIKRVGAHGRRKTVHDLYDQAASAGVYVEPIEYKEDPNFVKKPVVKLKKRLTLSDQLKLKRKKAVKFKLSFTRKLRRRNQVRVG